MIDLSKYILELQRSYLFDHAILLLEKFTALH